MKSEALLNYPAPTLTIIGMLIFFVLFVGLLFWVFRKSGKSTYDKIAQLPLDKEKDR